MEDEALRFRHERCVCTRVCTRTERRWNYSLHLSIYLSMYLSLAKRTQASRCWRLPALIQRVCDSSRAAPRRRGCDSPGRSVHRVSLPLVSLLVSRRDQREHIASGNRYDNELGSKGRAPRLAIVSLPIDIRGPSNCSLSAPSENTARPLT